MKLNLKRISSFFILAMTLVAPKVTQASDDENFNRKAIARKSGDLGIGSLDQGFHNGLPKDIMCMIFARASENGTHPADLASVCANWHDVMREDKLPDANLNYSILNPFMKTCMSLYWQRHLRNMQLIHTNPNTDEKTLMSVPTNADLLNFVFESENPDIFSRASFTSSVDKFFEVNGADGVKIVTLAITYVVAKNLYPDKFKGIIEKWDPKVAPVGLFWRLTYWRDLTRFDYLVTASVGDLSARNLYNNWQQSKMSGLDTYRLIGGDLEATGSQCFIFKLT